MLLKRQQHDEKVMNQGPGHIPIPLERTVKPPWWHDEQATTQDPFVSHAPISVMRMEKLPWLRIAPKMP
jgi:hypothetical protein